MDGITNIEIQQPKQSISQTHIEIQKQPEAGTESKDTTKLNDEQVKIDSKEKVESLVDDLNKAMEPMNTSLKFGVDRDDIFYVSVIESETNQMIRRFPAEKAESFLDKMQELTGMLFDSKG